MTLRERWAGFSQRERYLVMAAGATAAGVVGAGMGIGQAMGQAIGQAMQPGGAPGAAAPAQSQPQDAMQLLEKLHDLKTKGVITEEEFSAKKADLLKQM